MMINRWINIWNSLTKDPSAVLVPLLPRYTPEVGLFCVYTEFYNMSTIYYGIQDKHR